MRSTIRVLSGDPTKEKGYVWECDMCGTIANHENYFIKVFIDGVEYDLCDDCFMNSLGSFITDKSFDIPQKINVEIKE